MPACVVETRAQSGRRDELAQERLRAEHVDALTVLVGRVFRQGAGYNLRLFLNAFEPFTNEAGPVRLDREDAAYQHHKREGVEQNNTARQRGKPRSRFHARHAYARLRALRLAIAIAHTIEGFDGIEVVVDNFELLAQSL